MKPSFYNLLLAALASAALIIPFTGKVHDGRSKWFKGFTTRGWILCGVVFISFVTTYLKDVQAEKDDNIKLIAAKSEKSKDDSILRKQNDESNAKVVNTFTGALAKYGLKYDSAQKVIQKLVKDSSKKEIKYTYGNHPELAVFNIELQKRTLDTLTFDISFFTKQAAAYNTTIRVYTVLDDGNKSLQYIPEGDKSFVKDVLIPLDKILELPRYINGDISSVKNGTFYFVFIGKYFDSDNKQFPFKVISSCNLNTKRFGTIAEPEYAKLIDLLHKNGVKY